MFRRASGVRRMRQGRKITSIRIEANARRKALAPCGPTRENKVLAIAAPSWIETMATITRTTGTRGDEEAKFRRVKSDPDRQLHASWFCAARNGRVVGVGFPAIRHGQFAGLAAMDRAAVEHQPAYSPFERSETLACETLQGSNRLCHSGRGRVRRERRKLAPRGIGNLQIWYRGERHLPTGPRAAIGDANHHIA